MEHKHFFKFKLKDLVKKRGDHKHMRVIVPGMEEERANMVYRSKYPLGQLTNGTSPNIGYEYIRTT